MRLPIHELGNVRSYFHSLDLISSLCNFKLAHKNCTVELGIQDKF